MPAGINFFTRWNSLAAILTVGLLFCAPILKAQENRDDRYPRHDRQDDRQEDDRQGDDRQERDRDSRENGVSAGGNWMEYRVEDRMTAAKRVRFELPADDNRDSVDQARIVLYCTDRKMNLAEFRPNVRLGRPDWPGFWGQPQMHVVVRVDDSHSHHNWNWVNGHFLSMDKNTTRELLGAHLFRVEFRTPEGPKIAEFSPAGLDHGLVSSACGISPKKR